MLYPASDIDWQFNSYMIVYMLECHSPKSSHTLPLPLSPKVRYTHLCLFCCLAYRVIPDCILFQINILFSGCLPWFQPPKLRLVSSTSLPCNPGLLSSLNVYFAVSSTICRIPWDFIQHGVSDPSLLLQSSTEPGTDYSFIKRLLISLCIWTLWFCLISISFKWHSCLYTTPGCIFSKHYTVLQIWTLVL